MSAPCQSCGTDTSRPHARFCDRCRPAHRRRRSKYGSLTPERAAWLREHYHPDEHGRGWTGRLAVKARVPKWRLTRWASSLGLATPQRAERRAWTPDDDAHLERRLEAGRTMEVIARELQRSITACVVRSKRLAISRRACRQGLSALQLSIAMGVDSHKVTRWIDAGLLRAERRGTARTDAQGGDEWVIHDAAVREFLRTAPTAYSLARVDQLWFLDLVFGSTLGDRREVAA